MGRNLIKPNKDEDFYVEWSSISDSPIAWGSKEVLTWNRHTVSAEREFRYADEKGNSWGDTPFEIYEQRGIVKHSDLKELCLSLNEDGTPTEESFQWVDDSEFQDDEDDD